MSSSSPLSTRLRDDNLPPVFTQRNPKALKPHPWNSSIYGEAEDVTELISLIRASEWVKPLVLTPTGTIISGHRRWKAVLALGWEKVPVEVREFASELAELEALLLENASRFKTTEQKVREAQAWKEVETHKARTRQLLLAGTRPNSNPDLQENFPEGHLGQARDAIASRVDLGSGRNYEKAAKVVTQIDEEASLGHPEIAQALRKVLNEQSVNAAHMLLKKSPQERHAIARLIVSGEAKSIKQAGRMVKQNYTEFNDPFSTACAGFSIGDWVEVNNTTVSFKPYAGQRGQVEQVLIVESQISVKLEDGPSKIRFYPHELTLIVKATPPCPYKVSDIVFVDIDRYEAVSAQEKKWNGYWGKVMQISDRGSVTVDVGEESLQLFPRDLKPIDAPSFTLREVVQRVQRLRSLELDEIEEKMLDVFQRREWFTPRQLDYLDFMEKLYFANRAVL
jgi:ParB-like chromosome segregation protein Spo0J/ribosomal protein L21E